ncbi:type VI secretion system Vgr family protein [Variovorax sp. DAIF25]|uniref:type VI secretion system Vgr family protein n=1 Tax=Variovorax sp. DAIF25 TaxID=3080983 RepID=UPI003D6A04DF
MHTHDIRIDTDSPVANDLMFWSLIGHEGLSRAAVYELTVLSKNGHVQPKDILGRAFDIGIDFIDAHELPHTRHCHGHAVRFLREGRTGRYHRYRITLRSWFWLLTKRRNSRIFQDKPVLDVLDGVFEDSPARRIRKTNADGVIGAHEPHRYCVQFQESDHDFLSRLLEAEGIYYWFDAHDEPGRLQLADTSFVAHKRLPATPVLHYTDVAGEARFNEITRWISTQRLETGKHAARDSDFKAIRKNIGATIDAADEHELAEFEDFEYPGDYFSVEHAEATARIRGEELIARRDRHWAVTTWPDVGVGRSFVLEGDAPELARGEHLIGACSFVITHPGYEGADDERTRKWHAERLCGLIAGDAVNDGADGVLDELIRTERTLHDAQRGVCVFFLTVLPMQLPFRPPRLTPRVTMPGPQTAIVVGPAGDELHVDEHGRVKVHFHWDRYDESNEKSTCWVRVSQPWAGKGWGGYFAPRIGQEVIVDFLNGDPDRPVIVGRVYNDDQPIPYKSPTQSGFRTRSTPGGDASNYNEIQFEDRKGEELLSVHAERDMRRVVERDDATYVGRDQTLTVDHDQTQQVGHDRMVHVANNDRSIVDGMQKQTIKKDQLHHVVGKQDAFVDADRNLTVQKNSKVDVGGQRVDITRADETRDVLGNKTVTVGGDYSFKARNIRFEAAHYDFVVTGANSTVVTSPKGPYSILANEVKVISNTNVSTFAVGDINETSIGSNQTVIGSNSSGYIGSNSEANMGIARTSFGGLSLETAMGISISNFLGLQIENAAALRLETVAGIGIEIGKIKMLHTGLFNIAPVKDSNAGGSPPSVASKEASEWAMLMTASGALSGLGYYYADKAETLRQYKNAVAEMRKASTMAWQAELTGLAHRMETLADALETRSASGWTRYVPVLGELASAAADPAYVGLAEKWKVEETDSINADDAAPDHFLYGGLDNRHEHNHERHARRNPQQPPSSPKPPPTQDMPPGPDESPPKG